MGYKDLELVPDNVDLTKLNLDLDSKDRPTRQEAAIGMRMNGAPLTEIARTLGYVSATQCRQAIEAGLASIVGEESREQMRYIEARRLERLMRGLWKKATDEKDPEHLAAVRTQLGVIDRHARLFGLDAPAELVLYNPVGLEVEQWVQGWAAKLRNAGPEEKDIIEGSVLSSIDDAPYAPDE